MPTIKEPHQFFILISILFGILFTFVIPPFQSPDEYNHYYKSWRISEGSLLPEKLGQNRLGGELPISLQLLQKQFIYLKDNHSAKTSYNHLRQASKIKLNPDVRKFIDYPNTAVYAPTSYLPQALGILSGKLLNLGPLYILYLVRLFNLLAWIYLVSLALRQIKFQQWSMAYAALLPSSLVMAASANADNITNGLCYLLVSSFISPGNFTLITKAIFLAIVSINKIIFAPLTLLYWLYEKSIFYFIVLTFIAFFSAFVWGSFAQKNIVTYENYDINYREGLTMNEGVNPSAQMKFIIKNPVKFLKIMVTGFCKSIPATTVHLFGKFGWEKNYLPVWMILLLISGFIICIFSQANSLLPKARVIIAGVIVLGFTIFSAVMYMIWCPVGFPVLDVFGGRYFFVFTMMLPFVTGFLFFKKNTQLLLLISKFILIFGNVVTLCCIIERYY